uniref:Transmembrane protein 177 n=1 Tax=Neogobius melanostomus TaxID=47308 RepID=A0A8C6V3N6_9GOBI
MASGWLRASVFLQKYRSPLLLTSCSGLFGLNLIQHLTPEQSFCTVYQAWFKGEPTLFQQVLSDFGVSSPQRFSAFASFGFHPVGAGLPVAPSGVRIGIPANFNSSEDDAHGITDRTIFINGRAVDWSSGSGSALQVCGGEEVARLDSCFPALTAAVAPLCVAGVWVYSVALKQIFSLHTGPVLLRAAANALSLGLGAVTYFMASDAVGSTWTTAPTDGGTRRWRALMGNQRRGMYAATGKPFPANLLPAQAHALTGRGTGCRTLVLKDKVSHQRDRRTG